MQLCIPTGHSQDKCIVLFEIHLFYCGTQKLKSTIGRQKNKYCIYECQINIVTLLAEVPQFYTFTLQICMYILHCENNLI